MNLFRPGAARNARRTSKCDCASCKHLIQEIFTDVILHMRWFWAQTTSNQAAAASQGVAGTDITRLR